MISIRWNGHSYFEFKNEYVLVIDPHDGISIGLPTTKTKADYVLVTHDHFDHNWTRGVEKKDTKIIRSAEGGKLPDGEVKGILCYHDALKGKKRGEIIAFKFEMDGINFCHLGDIGHRISGELRDEIGDVEILFVPVGSVFTVGASDAWDIINTIQPKVAVPMHYKIPGLSIALESVDKFTSIAEGNGVEIVEVGNEIEVMKEDLPDSLEVWIFSL